MATNYDKGTDIQHRSYEAPVGDPNTGTLSDIGEQFNTFYWEKKALIELKKEMIFGQLADTTSMPKHFGKKIKKYHYLPLLDDRNTNDQGINVAGAYTNVAGTPNFHWVVFHTSLTAGNEMGYMAAVSATVPFANAAAAVLEWNVRYPDGPGADGTTATHAELASAGTTGTYIPGNLYGSSKDAGTITSKLPALSEHGGRVNRVGFKRIELEGSLEKFGFFDEYTQESMDFDTDSELMMHVNREMLRGANEITEDALQIDILNGAGVTRFAGAATSIATLIATDLVTYDDLQKLSRDLDDNRMPKNTKIINGSRMVDTRTIDGARYLYIGSELVITMRNMVDSFSNPAFIPVHQYGAATVIANGEIGSVGEFRVVVAPEMTHQAGGGATTASTAVYTTTNATGIQTDAFPMLIIGSGAFTTIGFQTDGKSTKFNITHKKPGKETADRNDPYGETGFMSIKWYYGHMIQRPEWIAVVWTAATY